ncbi:hypothetical protein BFS86_08990 [Shewanella algae]|nr:hypothetical protein BFS86_08990 [Shewanella algae]
MTTNWIFKDGHPLAETVELLPALIVNELHNLNLEDVDSVEWTEVPREVALQALEGGQPVIFSDDCSTYLKGTEAKLSI